jgi:predicted transcriptional regulator with HTH domain
MILGPKSIGFVTIIKISHKGILDKKILLYVVKIYGIRSFLRTN